MKQAKILVIMIIAVFLTAGASSLHPSYVPEDGMISCIVDPGRQDLQLYWKDDSGNILGSIQRLKDHVEHKHKELMFAMNGGMFKPDRSPRGLLVQRSVILAPVDTSGGEGNFYLKPNGVLYITSGKKAAICKSEDFVFNNQVRFATQSGPMLLVHGAIHPAFRQGSTNLNIRNGVGILTDGRLLFAMSRQPINFYDFADYFKRAGCQNALFLDGFVSRVYLPAKNWVQMDGDFGVIIGVTK
jgi:uncharacterized protein YigE (DUF2233 family)